MGTNLSRATFRVDIQILRGIAVTAVVLFHANEGLFPQGFLGVDVFFVISGFVVTPSIMKIFSQKTSTRTEVLGRLKVFYLRRFFRLAPAFGVTLILSVPLILIFASVSEYLRFAKQGLASIVLLGNLGAYFFSGSNYFAPNPNPLIHLWSLSSEEQIYLMLPALLAIPILRSGRSKFTSPIIVIASLGFIAFAADVLSESFPIILQSLGVVNPQSLMFYLPISRFWEFAFGALLSFYLLEKRINSRLTTLAGNISLISLGILLFGHFEITHSLSLIVSILTSLVIIFHPLDATPRLLRKAGSRIGDSSYSIYLLHMPLIYVARYSPVLDDRKRTENTILAVFFSFALGFISSKYLEARFRNPQLENVKVTKILMHRLVIILIIPTIMLAGIVFADSSSYWGKNPNGIGPIIANYECDGTIEKVPCSNYADGSIGEALLIGDSHAQALSIAFKVAMSAARFTSYILTKPGCQYITQDTVNLKIGKILGFNQRLAGDSESNTCFQHNEEIREWVFLHPNAIIFIANRSSSFLPTEITTSKYNNTLLENAKSLKTLTNQVVLIGPNPEFPDENYFFTGNLAIWQDPYLPYEKLSRSRMKKEPFQDDQFFLINSPLISVKYISSIGAFCTSLMCVRRDGARWLYVAKGHLSVDGANRFIPQFLESVTLD